MLMGELGPSPWGFPDGLRLNTCKGRTLTHAHDNLPVCHVGCSESCILNQGALGRPLEATGGEVDATHPECSTPAGLPASVLPGLLQQVILSSS